MIRPADDTIAAVSTPAGQGALAIVRFSGCDAVAIADRVFAGRRSLAESPSRVVQLGTVRDPEGRAIDHVLATVMRAPRSYTGEDVVEFSGHGGLLVSRLILDAVLRAGARPAQPGEFTRRAFLSGRIDLAQAEAVIGIIQARGERALRNALAQLEGGLSARVGAVRETLLGILAPIEAFIEFGDDVPEPPDAAWIREGLRTAGAAVLDLLAGSRRGRLMAEGISVGLVGRPNVGKSSLLNALCGQDRALVHEAPGTTRDTVDAVVTLRGVPVRLVDTAGVGDTDDPVERAGVDRARRVMETSDLCIFVMDAAIPPGEGELALAAELGRRPFLVARNKVDLGDDPESRRFAAGLEVATCVVSAVKGRGVPGLLEALGAEVERLTGGDEDVAMAGARHDDALRRAGAALERGERALAAGSCVDMLAADIREALDALGEVTGERAGPDVLARVFSQFCVGK